MLARLLARRLCIWHWFFPFRATQRAWRAPGNIPAVCAGERDEWRTEPLQMSG